MGLVAPRHLKCRKAELARQGPENADLPKKDPRLSIPLRSQGADATGRRAHDVEKRAPGTGGFRYGALRFGTGRALRPRVFRIGPVLGLRSAWPVPLGRCWRSGAPLSWRLGN